MPDSSLANEILHLIVQEFIALNAPSPPYVQRLPDPSQIRDFAPRSYLLPLLRVSRQWYKQIVPDLYRAIGSGTPPPYNFKTGPTDTAQSYMERHAKQNRNRGLRSNYQVLLAIHDMLVKDPVKAAWVRTLRLGTEDSTNEDATRLHVAIIHVCPSLRHVEIRGCHKKFRVALLNILRRKSLFTFSVSHSPLQSLAEPIIRSEMPSIFSTLGDWPELRTISNGRFLQVTIPPAFEPTRCCPHLHDIDLHNFPLTAEGVRFLRLMCSEQVTGLGLTAQRAPENDTRAAQNIECPDLAAAISECLHAWSSTLVSFRFHASFSLGGFFQSLNDDFPSLTHLVHLTANIKLKFQLISQLRFLTSLHIPYDYDNREIVEFETLLRDYFPSLKELTVLPSKKRSFSVLLREACDIKKVTILASPIP